MTAYLQLPERGFTTSADAEQVADLVSSALADGTVVTIDLVDGALLLNGAAAVAVTLSDGGGDSAPAGTGGGPVGTSKMGRMSAPGTVPAPEPGEDAGLVGAEGAGLGSQAGNASPAADEAGTPPEELGEGGAAGAGVMRTSKMGRHGSGQLAVGASSWRLASSESPEFRLREAMETGRVVQVEVLDQAGAPARLLLRGHGLAWAALTAG